MFLGQAYQIIRLFYYWSNLHSLNHKNMDVPYVQDRHTNWLFLVVALRVVFDGELGLLGRLWWMPVCLVEERSLSSLIECE